MLSPRPLTIILVMFTAHVAMMTGFSTFPTLLPRFIELWSLSGTQAGIISASLFLGYTFSVPFLVAMTDRIDPKKVYLFGGLLISISHIGFALFARNGSTATVFMSLFGIGLAATYMPGLRILGEHLPSKKMARATGFYTAGYSFGAAASYIISHKVSQNFDWQSVYYIAAITALCGFVLVAFLAHPHQPQGKHMPWRKVLDPRPAFANKPAMAFSVSYGLHTLELMTMRSWVVAFLTASTLGATVQSQFLQPANIAAFMTLLGIVASLTGNEIAIRFGRRSTISWIMVLGGIAAIAAALSFQLSYQICLIMVIIHGFIVMLDSSALTAGAFEEARPGQRGITMAVHSTIGFAGGALGPFLFGLLLDIFNHSPTGWMVGYGHMALFVFFGPLVFRLLWPRKI